MDEWHGPCEAITRSTSHKVRSWEDDSVSEDEPTAIQRGVQARVHGAQGSERARAGGAHRGRNEEKSGAA